MLLSIANTYAEQLHLLLTVCISGNKEHFISVKENHIY